jgi:hypothetical protein
MCIFLGQKKYGIWGDFSEKFQVLFKNPDEVTRFDGSYFSIRVRRSSAECAAAKRQSVRRNAERQAPPSPNLGSAPQKGLVLSGKQ